MEHTTEELEAAAERRAETSDRLVESDAERKLIIAGPGTGKTYNFRRGLKAAGGDGLALTFIRALARELERDLGDLAQVNTFHGYCKQLAYKLPLDGLRKGLDYYPPLLMLTARAAVRELLADARVRATPRHWMRSETRYGDGARFAYSPRASRVSFVICGSTVVTVVTRDMYRKSGTQAEMRERRYDRDHRREYGRQHPRRRRRARQSWRATRLRHAVVRPVAG